MQIIDDLTTGPIRGHFRRLAIPAAVGMLFSTLYNVVDTFYAGYFGTQAQAGLTIGYQAFFVLVAVGFGIGSAMSALVGNAKGRKDVADAADKTALARIVADYIAGMTDRFAIQQHKRLIGGEDIPAGVIDGS